MVVTRRASATQTWTATFEKNKSGDVCSSGAAGAEFSPGINETKGTRVNAQVLGEQVYSGSLACKVTVHPDDTFTFGQNRVDIQHKSTLTAEGKERFQDQLINSGPAAWEDDEFGVHFAFFSQTDAAVRMRILEGRRNRLEERLDHVKTSVSRTRERVDSYTLELQRHGLESVEREVRWLTELIETERRGETNAGPAPSATAV